MAKRIRIKDIGDHLGISASTVSRALNPKTSTVISDEVVAKVKAAARELNYINDFAAASLKNKQSYTIGVVIPDILNPVFPPIVKGIQETLAKAGYVTFTVYSNNQQEEAVMEIRKLVGRRVDGIIIASAFLEDRSVDYCLKQDIPLVAVNRSIHDGHLIHQVLDDDAFGITLAVNHLMEMGHRHLAHFAGPQNILHGVERLESFIECCRKNGLTYDILHCASFDVRSGIQSAKEFLLNLNQATAIIAGNDLIAIGAIKHFMASNIRVPEDISIVGFNGMPFSDMLNPSLTTVAIPHESLGQQAARLLLNAIEDVDGPRQKVLLTPKLVIGNSTAIVRHTTQNPSSSQQQ